MYEYIFIKSGAHIIHPERAGVREREKEREKVSDKIMAIIHGICLWLIDRLLADGARPLCGHTISPSTLNASFCNDLLFFSFLYLSFFDWFVHD